MVSMNTLFIIVVICMVSPSVVTATEYKVGDDSGWTIKFDYVAWAKDKDFHVGDKLVFNYPAGAHNVFKVNATGFKECIVPPVSEALTTGNDVITLATPGHKWYLCGVGQHCTVGGQKLSITVLPALEVSDDWEAPSPAPVSANSAIRFTKSGYQILRVLLIAIGMIGVV